MPMVNVPDDVFDRVRAVAERTRRPVEEEIVRTLSALAEKPVAADPAAVDPPSGAVERRLPISLPRMTDECSAPGPIPLHGPGRPIAPRPGGRLTPSTPILLAERETA